MEIKNDIAGSPYYENQPAGTRVASRDDFFQYGERIINMPYLVKVFYDEIFYAKRTNESFKIEKLKPWLDVGRVFVFD